MEEILEEAEDADDTFTRLENDDDESALLLEAEAVLEEDGAEDEAPEPEEREPRIRRLRDRPKRERLHAPSDRSTR
jgi:hypothetical protein